MGPSMMSLETNDLKFTQYFVLQKLLWKNITNKALGWLYANPVLWKLEY